MAPRQLTDQQIRVLRLRAFGASYHEIATRLHISKSTVYRERSVIMNTLRARSPFQLGVYSVRNGYLPSVLVFRVVTDRWPTPNWVQPTAAQIDILNLRALGWSVSDAAARLGISERTLRDQIRNLRTANCIERLGALPALAEALGWINEFDEHA